MPLSGKRGNNLGILPTEWIEKVVAILDTGKAGTRAVTNTARLDWMTLFPDSFSFEIYSVISSILKLGAITDARKVETMNEPGEVYEFLFVYRSRRMYSKVNLCEGKVSVLVYSAHLQRLGNIEEGRFA